MRLQAALPAALCLAGVAAAAAAVAPQGLPREQVLEARRLADAAALALFAAAGPRLEAELIAPTEPLALPAGAVALTARACAGQPLARRMCALVDVSVDGRAWRTVPVWFAVRAPRPARVARHALEAGAVPRAEDFEEELRDAAAPPAPPLPAQAPLDGMRLRLPLAPGQALAAVHLQPRPAVERNQPVVVRLQANAVRIEAAGVALADARIGDRVQVRNAVSGQVFAARVVAAGAVEPQER